MIREGASADDAGFDIRPLESEDVESILQILTQAFGPGFDHEWFNWKHQQSPWGSSHGWVAHDGSSLLGVRLFLPWRFRNGDKVYRALRPCDTVTAPHARGRGVFRSLTQYAISRLGNDVEFLFNTPNENSKPGYLKMGFVDWGEVPQRVSLVWPGRADLTDEPEPSNGGFGLKTETDQEFLSWRYGDCPGRQYWSFGLAGEMHTGMVCRIREWRGMRLMVVSELWGDSRQQAMLVKGAAHELGARVAWLGHPIPNGRFPSLRRPGTAVTRYDLVTEEPGPQLLSLGDVEDVL